MTPRPLPRVVITKWSPATAQAKFTVGFATVVMTDLRVTFHSVPIRRTDEGDVFATLPTVPLVRAGKQVKSETGGYSYAPAISFMAKQDYLDFSTAVVAALREAHPEAFARRGLA